MLVGLHKHSDEGLHHTADQLPATRKSAFVRYMGQKCRMLLDTLEVLQKVSAAPTDAVACDEMSLLLCELLHGSQCDIYQVPSSDGQNFLKINRKVFLPVSSHGLLHRAEHTFEGDRSGKPVTYSNLDLHGERGGAAARDADRDDSVALLEWYEPRFGYRELLVRAAEQDRIAAMMRERGFKTSRASHRLKEYGHVMIIPVWEQPKKPRGGHASGHASSHGHGHGHGQGQGESGHGHAHDSPKGESHGPQPTLVALIQLMRDPHGDPFSADDEYLAGILAPHLEAALRRSRLLTRVQLQLGKMMKLHTWAGNCKLESPEDLCNVAASLFPADDIALYAMTDEDEFGNGQGGASKRGHKSGRKGASKEGEDDGGVTLKAVRRGATIPADSASGLEVLCTSGQSLAISLGGGSQGFDAQLNLLRRPLCAVGRSMLCVPAFIHRETLKMNPPANPTEEASVVPCVLQWANGHGLPFGRSDMLVASAFSETLGRLASQRSLRTSLVMLEDRFQVGDMRRNALMESARMLANRMEMEELFAAVMLHAKDLMEVQGPCRPPP